MHEQGVMDRSGLLDEERGIKDRSAAQPTFLRTFTDAWTRSTERIGWYSPTFDEAWTRAMLDRYDEVQAKGVKGDVPTDVVNPGFANKPIFWSMALCAIIFGIITGIMGLIVQNNIEKWPEVWTNNGMFDEATDYDINGGKRWWIAVPTIGGLIVGLLSVYTDFPDERDGFFKEINECHVNVPHVPMTVIISTISMSVGASVGPEQAMATFGGGLAIYFLERYGQALGIVEDDDRRLTIMSGFCAAMGGLFPTPIISNTLIQELARPPKLYMEYMTIFSFAALSNYFVIYALRDSTYMNSIDQVYFTTATWEFRFSHMWRAFLIGIVGSGLGLGMMVVVGICKQIFVRLRERIDGISGNKYLSRIISPTIGGLLIGIMAWTVPGTIGDGNMVMSGIVKFGIAKEDGISTHVLLATAFSKMFTMGISMNCGLVGGFVFPTVTIAVIFGTAAFQLMTSCRYDVTGSGAASIGGYDNCSPEPYGLYVSCFMVAVPAAVCPMPLTLILIAISVFSLGLNQISCITIAVFTSYFLTAGSGLLEKIGQRQKAAADNKANEAKHKQLPNTSGKILGNSGSMIKSHLKGYSDDDDDLLESVRFGGQYEPAQIK